MTSPSIEYALYVGSCSACCAEVGSPGTGGSWSFATNLVGATSSTTRSLGVGNSTSNVSIRASSPKLLNLASSHSALSLSYGEPTWWGRAERRRMYSRKESGEGMARIFASQSRSALAASVE